MSKPVVRRCTNKHHVSVESLSIDSRHTSPCRTDFRVDFEQAQRCALSGEMGKLARQIRRAARLTAFLSAALYGLWEHRKLWRGASRAECAEWLHQSCARGLSAINVQVSTIGASPPGGLIVSNHLSYLDILVLSAAVPCVFVSKAEVDRWPIFGRYARWAGSVFVRRHDKAGTARANFSVAESLRSGVPVVLFPEGTTTDGRGVLRFHSTMLQPAIDAGAQVTPCSIRYELDEGAVDREVSWWGNMPLLPHVWNLLSKRVIRTTIMFGEPMAATGDRKQLSQTLHHKVVRLHEELSRSKMSGTLAASVRK